MQNKKKLNNFKKTYTAFFSFFVILNIIFSTLVKANNFRIKDLVVTEPFELNFNKEKVIEKGFILAFAELTKMITTSSDSRKVENTSFEIIKNLVDTFKMSNERFVDNQYIVNFDVNFNKKNILNFFNKKNIYPSPPNKKNVLLIPILVNLQSSEINFFNGNIFYQSWNKEKERSLLLNYLLPNEDLEDINLLVKNKNEIENYDFKKTIDRYDLNDYIIVIIYKNNNKLTVLSKIKLNESLKIVSGKFENINVQNSNEVDIVLKSLKEMYENYWKNINQINTSIKTPITISIDSKNYKKIKILEKKLDELDLVEKYEILRFNNNNTYYKIIYNGSPVKLINDMSENNIIIKSENLTWKVQ